MDSLGALSGAAAARLNRRRFLARAASLLAGGAAAALAPALARAGSPPDKGFRGGETLANVLDVPVIRVVDEGGAVRSVFRAHATPHTFLVHDGRIADQLLRANVERVLAMVAPDASRALSGVGAA